MNRRTARTPEKRETVSLIGSDKVQGTAVYGADGEKIGSIERAAEIAHLTIIMASFRLS
jgi:hypothetical protein